MRGARPPRPPRPRRPPPRRRARQRLLRPGVRPGDVGRGGPVARQRRGDLPPQRRAAGDARLEHEARHLVRGAGAARGGLPLPHRRRWRAGPGAATRSRATSWWWAAATRPSRSTPPAAPTCWPACGPGPIRCARTASAPSRGAWRATGPGSPTPPLGRGWAWDDLGDSYAAPVGALQFNEGFAVLEVTPGDSAGAPARRRAPAERRPAAALRLGRDRAARLEREQRGLLPRPVHRLGHRVRARSRPDAAPVSLEVAVPDPVRYFEAALTQVLREAGIAVLGQATPVAPAPPATPGAPARRAAGRGRHPLRLAVRAAARHPAAAPEAEPEPDRARRCCAPSAARRGTWRRWTAAAPRSGTPCATSASPTTPTSSPTARGSRATTTSRRRRWRASSSGWRGAPTSTSSTRRCRSPGWTAPSPPGCAARRPRTTSTPRPAPSPTCGRSPATSPPPTASGWSS